MHFRAAIAALALLGAIASCSSGPTFAVPADFVDVPGRADPEAVAVRAARALGDRGADRDALAAIEAVLARAPRWVDAHRMRQDILRRRGRLGLVVREAEERLVAWDGDAAAYYLRGRLERDDAEKRRWFERALAVEPRSFWAWFGMAYCVRGEEPARADAIYRRLDEASGHDEIVAQAWVDVLRRSTDERARAALDGLRAHHSESGLADLAIAQAAFGSQRRREGWAPLLEALRRRPFDPELRALLHAVVATGLADEQVEQVLDVFAESRERTQRFVASGGAALLARLYERAGRLPEARDALARAKPSADVLRHRRRATLAAGDVRGWLDALARELPRPVVDDESNQLRGLWQRVLHGPWSTAPDPLADPAHATELCEALLAAGLLVELQHVGTLATARHDGDVASRDRIAALRDEARRELAFESGLRRMLYRGYAREPQALSAFLDEVRALAKRVLGEDVVGAPTTFAVPLVGELVDPRGEGLAAHLRRYNRHLVLGQRAGNPPEGMLVTRLSLRDLDDRGALPLPGRAFEVVGEDRQIESLTGLLGGDLAGIALLNHYVIDHDAVFDWAEELRERRRVIGEDGGAVATDPLPQELDDDEPLDIAWRLLALSPTEDKDLDAAVLDMVRWHERAHLADAFRYLPPERNLWRVLGLVVGNGFSARSVEGEMEGRAETAAAAYATDLRLVLAHIATFLEDGGPATPHAAGFARLAHGLNEILVRDAATHAGATAHWHRVDETRIRAAARELAARYWP
ncbi:MAG: hypothetical protein HZB39_02985 [Planctomycetes bacterium]|nr:hypothetical protein [Planctomycetota bacterium]